MKSRKQMLIILQFIIVLFIMINSNFIHGSTNEWIIGSNYLVSEKNSTLSHVKDLENEINIHTNNEMKFDRLFNITAIDNLSKLIYYDIQLMGVISQSIQSYDPEWFITNRLEVSNLFYTTFDWDYNHNKTVLTGFSFSFIPLIFIEANWSSINDHFANTVLNESNVLYSLVDPFNPSLTHNFTFGDLINNATSYTIMGVKNDLEEAKLQFTSDVHHWEFVFDLTDYIKNQRYNSTSGLYDYLPFDTFIVKTEFEYTEDGVLKHYLNRNEYSFSIDNKQLATITEKLMVLGGIEETTESNLAYFLLFPTLFIMIVYKRIRERGKQ